MSDTDVVQVLDLPEAENTPTTRSRKTIYRTGQTNTFTFTRDGEELEGYLTFDAARLISLACRVQVAKGRKSLVVTQGIVLDGLEVGTIDENDVRIPHDLFTEPRYAAWRNSNRPKRVNASQWVQAENYPLVRALAKHLQDEHNWSIIERPEKRKDSNRTTQDLFVARPPRVPQNETQNYGVKLDAFEVSVNPEYIEKGPGFSSFVEGLDEQRDRWEGAFKPMPAEHREQLLKKIAENIHFVGGVYRDEKAKSTWARPIDVGMVALDGQEFPLYQQRSSELSDDLFAELFEGEQSADEPTPEELSLPDSF